MYIKKQIETKHGILADCWGTLPQQKVTVVENGFLVEGNLALWASPEAKESNKEILDNCIYKVEISLPTIEAVLNKIVENGILNCNAGVVDFSGCEIVP